MAALAYAANNAVELIDPSSPQINKIKTTNYSGNSREEAQSLAEAKFKIAFTLKDFRTRQTLNDTRYIQWQAAHYTSDENLQPVFDPLSFHECTKEDYAQFHPAASDQAAEVEKLKEDGLFCLDDIPSDFVIGGSFDTDFVSSISYIFYPCHVRPSALFKGLGDEIGEDCIADLAAQEDYLQAAMIYWFYNSDSFEDLGFGQESITRESRVSQVQFDAAVPSWTQTDIAISELHDTSDIFQLTGETVSTLFDLESDLVANPSAYKQEPTEKEPDNVYIFTSLYVGQGKNLMTINRKTYSLLDWLGDWGGLLDGLRLVAQLLISPLSSLALKS